MRGVGQVIKSQIRTSQNQDRPLVQGWYLAQEKEAEMWANPGKRMAASKANCQRFDQLKAVEKAAAAREKPNDTYVGRRGGRGERVFHR